MERIVSLLPSTTEIACALGFGPQLVGRSHECDFPPEIRDLPVLTRPKLDARAGSREIDDRVKSLVRDGLSVYEVDADGLRELAPTHILTQDQCEVCAASLGDLESALAIWTGERPKVVSLSPQTLGDVWRSIIEVAVALSAGERGSELTNSLADRLTEIAERTPSQSRRPRVACIEWLDPLMAAGNWIPELVTLAGGQNLLGRAGSHSAWLTVAELTDADPDVIVVLPCGFYLGRTREELMSVIERPPWPQLRAVEQGRVFLTDGNQFFNRPGPRLVESLAIFSEIFHPKTIEPVHRGTGWDPL